MRAALGQNKLTDFRIVHTVSFYLSFVVKRCYFFEWFLRHNVKKPKFSFRDANIRLKC